MLRPSVICFDIGGTLLDTGPSFAAAIQRRIDSPLLRADWDRFFNLATGSADDDLATLAAHYDLAVEDIVREYREHAKRPAELFPDVLPGLRALAGIRCVALSNAPRWLTGRQLRGAEAHITQIYYSHAIGHAKPDREAFRHVERATGARQQSILMVGDSLNYDYRAARAAGWQAILLDRQNRYAGQRDVRRITGLDGLVDHLERRREEGPFEAEGAVKRVGPSLLVTLPGELLDSKYTARPVRVRSEEGACRAQLARGPGGDAVLLLGRAQSEALKLPPDAARLRLRLDVVDEKLQVAAPADLKRALLDAGLSWDSIPERDRHLAVGLIKEATTPALRLARIQRIVSSFVEESK